MNELLDEKMKIALNLIRTNNTADEILKITQAVLNMAHVRSIITAESCLEPEQNTGTKTIKKLGAGA